MEKLPKTPNLSNTEGPAETGERPEMRKTYTQRGEKSFKATRETVKNSGGNNNINKPDGKNSESLKLPRIGMEDFKKGRNSVVVDSDMKYLAERKKDFAPKGQAAAEFERIVSNGLITDRWLGNIPGKDGRVPFRVANIFLAENAERLPYDDVVNKIDCVVALSILGREKPVSVGFDVTLDERALEDKLLRSNTKPDRELPFGFSALDYAYTREGEILPNETNVPRYTLTMDMSTEKADEYHRNWYTLRLTRPENREKEYFKQAREYIGKHNARTRFIVLSEIYEQNKLYQAMLPALDGKHNRVIQEAQSKLEAVGSKVEFAAYRAALHCPLTVDVVASKEAQGVDGTKSVRGTGDVKSAEAVEAQRAAIFQEIKACSDSTELDPAQKRERILALRQELYTLISGYMRTQDSHYGAMMTETDKLSRLGQEGKINHLKEIRARNKVLAV
ncbi:hypothetical protein IKE72_00285 [Candidatus Saccharibacteria bacterium]|nr:hypothetical protein [Candidatus Saccharibacteria bacterium]